MKMKTSHIAALLGAAFIAACSERPIATAPAADAVAVTPSATIGDRPYTWSVQCSGSGGWPSSANWSWTAAGVTIDGTAVSAQCFGTVTGSGTRPAAADGFSACVNGHCKTWKFDPASAFSAELKGSFNGGLCYWKGPSCDYKVSGSATLTISS